MRVLVTGVAGQLGYDVVNELFKRKIVAIGTDIRNENELINRANWESYYKLDITDSEQVASLVLRIKPDAIIHCAAWTNVDGAEKIENRPLVKKVNVDGTNNLVKIAKEIGAKFLYISTDYVFNGEGKRPWEPDDKDYAPLNYYGKTKLEGELSVSSQLDHFFIVRIAWVFGLNGNNFIKTMLSLYNRGLAQLKVVNDQIGTPTYTYDLARLLTDMIQTDKYGYYHATNEGGYISWADFAEEIFRQINASVKVDKISTEEYGASVAKRPHNSRLNKSKLIENGFNPLPNWKDALRRYLEEIRSINMKGIILAGGSGTRLYPLTFVTSKQLLPVYDKPMIYYPLSVLMMAGIRDILIISTSEDTPRMEQLLGNGSKFGINLFYKVQPSPDGLAQAFILGEEFIGNDACAMVLGDNIFYGAGLVKHLENSVRRAEKDNMATIYGYYVHDPERFGIVELDKDGNALTIEEKPKNPKSNYCVTGLYFYPKGVSEIAKILKPSDRGELEITSLNNVYLEQKRLHVTTLGRGYSWLDTGTHESLVEASNYIKILEDHQGLKVCCPEEIAYKNGWISKEVLKEQGHLMKKNQYGQHLLNVANGKIKY